MKAVSPPHEPGRVLWFFVLIVAAILNAIFGSVISSWTLFAFAFGVELGYLFGSHRKF